jgi:hypothetical protein
MQNNYVKGHSLLEQISRIVNLIQNGNQKWIKSKIIESGCLKHDPATCYGLHSYKLFLLHSFMVNINLQNVVYLKKLPSLFQT